MDELMLRITKSARLVGQVAGKKGTRILLWECIPFVLLSFCIFLLFISVSFLLHI